MGLSRPKMVLCLNAAAIVALSTPVTAKGNDAPSSLCTQNEETVFSCQIKQKILSVCSSKSLKGKDRYVQYRFGRRQAIELQYPAKREHSIDHFRLYHYFRANVDRWELSFDNTDTHYTVFSYFEGEEPPALHKGGVTINVGRRPGKFETLYCSTGYTEKFERLEDVVPATPDPPT